MNFEGPYIQSRSKSQIEALRLYMIRDFKFYKLKLQRISKFTGLVHL